MLPHGLLNARLGQQQPNVTGVLLCRAAVQLQGCEGLVHAQAHLGALVSQHQHVL